MTARTALGGVDLGRLFRFGMVGLLSTLLYATIAWSLTTWTRIDAAPASALAYGAAGLMGYWGQRRLTFRSTAAHSQTAPRFVAASALGAGIAMIAPLALTDRLGLPSIVAIAFTCGLVPLMNYVVLDRLVFPAGPKTVRS